MNIPESAIRPFEPLGIPRFEFQGDCEELLTKEFLHLNLLGEDDDYCMNLIDLEEYLTRQLNLAGAKRVWVGTEPRNPIRILITIYYAMPGMCLRRYRDTVKANGGFSMMKGGL